MNQNYQDEHAYAHALNQNIGLGPKALLEYHGYYGSFGETYTQILKSSSYRLNPKLEHVREKLSGLDPKLGLQKLEQQGIKVILYTDPEYPNNLAEIADKPALLYIKGDKSILEQVMIAVVGTRKISGYGSSVTGDLVEGFCDAGLVVVSGLALGVDSRAHSVCVGKSRPTIAVCPGGIDDISVYPRTNLELAHKIINSGGALISEKPPMNPIERYSFPIRNRIIAGLCVATLVVEASEGSGSLHTARAALEYNRTVFAVPGDIHKPGSIGPNNLIRMGAVPVTSVQDIFDELNIAPTQTSRSSEMPDLNSVEIQVLSVLESDTVHVDKIISRSKLETSLVNSTLILLEMKGVVKNLGNNHYIRKVHE